MRLQNYYYMLPKDFKNKNISMKEINIWYIYKVFKINLQYSIAIAFLFA